MKSDQPDAFRNKARGENFGARGTTERLRRTAERRELDEQEAAELNRCLADLAARLKDRPKVTIGYFVPDGRIFSPQNPRPVFPDASETIQAGE